MKYLIIICLTALCSCSNNSNQAKIYEDSAIYYSNLLAGATDSIGTGDARENALRKGRIQIYTIMRKHYIDKMNEAKK